MKDDPLRLQILKELRELRRGEGTLVPERIATCEALVRVIGMGSVEQAHATLFEMFKRYATEPDGDVRAFLETSGVGLQGASLNQRLDVYARVHFVERRTGLRRSDRGAAKLATLFRDEELYFRPWGHLTMYQFGDNVFTTIALHMDLQSEYHPPKVWVNDEPVNDLVFNFEEPTGDSSYVWARQDIDRFKLNRQARWLFKIDVEWRMPVWPQWVLGAQLADSRLAAKIQTQRNFMTEATIVWGAPLFGEMPKDAEFRSFPIPKSRSSGDAET